MSVVRRHIRLSLFVLLSTAILFVGCDASSVVDKEPQDQIAESAVFEDPTLADSYVFDLYDQMNFQHGYGFYSMMSWRWEHIGAEYVTGATWQPHYSMSLSVPDASGHHGRKGRRNWSNIRRANTIIEKLRNSETLSEDFIKTRVAEARFIRAFAYHRMAKRYGGVSLITKAQGVGTPRDSVFVPRSDERKIWDFIADELDAAAKNLPETHDGREGRATRWSALGLKSRAMMFAASVAEFGEMKTAGSGENSVQLGIPQSEADQYWQQALDAASTVIQEGPHSLYNEYPNDPARNYFELFITDATENPEVMLAELFDGQEKGHSNTFQNLPMEYAKSWGANAGATWHVVNLFNYQDGSDGHVSPSQLESRQWSADELFENRDPRFKGSVLYPESQFRDSLITFHSRTLKDGNELTRGADGWVSGHPEHGAWPASGPPRNISRTGLLVKKRTRTDQRPNQHGTDPTDYIEMRLGEMYMNAAEAAFELGRPNSEVLSYLDPIRERAGMPTFNTVTREKIRNERQREMVLEQRRYWDLRRWRTAHEVLDGLRVKGVGWEYDWSTKKYNVRVINAEGQERVFEERQYYLPLGKSTLASNPALVENPGY